MKTDQFEKHFAEGTKVFSRTEKRGQKIYREYLGNNHFSIPLTSRQFKRIKEISLIIEV